MERQSVYEPAKRSKGTSGNPAPLDRLPQASHLKKAVQSVERDISQLCSAFLAERGCLSPEESRKQQAA